MIGPQAHTKLQHIVPDLAFRIPASNALTAFSARVIDKAKSGQNCLPVITKATHWAPGLQEKNASWQALITENCRVPWTRFKVGYPKVKLRKFICNPTPCCYTIWEYKEVCTLQHWRGIRKFHSPDAKLVTSNTVKPCNFAALTAHESGTLDMCI